MLGDREIRIVLITFITSIFLLGIFISLFFFNDFFILYSGVLSFYSLIFIIFALLSQYFSKRRDEMRTQYELLHALSQEIDLIEEEVNYYAEYIPLGVPPIHNLSLFDQGQYHTWLEHNIGGKTTSRLKQKMFLANDKLDTLQSIRNVLWETKWDYGIKKDVREKNINEFLRSSLMVDFRNALKDFRSAIREMRNNLRVWRLY